MISVMLMQVISTLIGSVPRKSGRASHVAGLRPLGLYPLLFLLAAFAGGGQLWAASLKAEVKKQTVVDGETVLLYIIGEDLRGYPDTTALNRRFDIVGSRRQQSQFVDEGVVKSRYTMLLELLPKHLGVSDIPPFEVDGQRSEKISIEVVARGTPGVVPRDNVFAELSIDNETPYVQAQIILSLHVFDDGSLAAAEPEIPDIAAMQIEQIPGDPQRLETRDGVEYRVHTWRYALFPQRSGSYEIPRIKVVANVKDPSYGGNLILRNTPTRRISFRSDSMQLDVRPRPAQSKSEWWLPVKQIDLQKSWSSDPATSQVGEPLTYSVVLTTNGATSTQLPEIKLPDVDGLKIYPDVPELVSQPGEDSVISRRTDKWSIIPQRAGTITLPEYRLQWWDTVADRERVTVIPAQQLVVSGAAATASAGGANITNNAIDSANNTDSNSAENSVNAAALDVADVADGNSADTPLRSLSSRILPERNNLWVWIAAFVSIGWLVTLGAWLFTARRARARTVQLAGIGEPAHTSLTEQQTLRDLTALSTGGDRSRYLSAMMKWASARWPQQTPVSVTDVGRRLRSDELSMLLQQVESSLYSQQAGEASAQDKTLESLHHALRKAINSADESVRHTRAGTNELLPEL